MSFKLTQTMSINAVDYYLRCWEYGNIEHAVVLRVELFESTHSPNSSLVLLTLLQTLGHNSLKDPPRLVNQFMQLLAELLAFGSDSAKPARSCPTQQWSRISLQRRQHLLSQLQHAIMRSAVNDEAAD